MPEQAEATRATILVVDDNEANRSLARNALEDEGYRVVLAASGEEGVAAFEREHPDCVLLDVRMPGMDGFTACERIRALPGGDRAPILFLTALRDVDTFDRALRAGGSDFITKPVRPTELIVRIQTALQLWRVSAELRQHYDLLRHQRDDLLRLQLQKERLMAFVVHDLKNPVNSMDLNAQVLLRDKTLSEGSRGAAMQVRTEARQLARMILNLLDISKADEGKLAPRHAELDPQAMVSEILAELDVAAKSRKVTLRSTVEPGSVRVDPDLFRRTLANLVENAIRYAPAETAVTVTFTRAGGDIEVRIADAGRGILPELREKVFDPFVQGDAAGDAGMAPGGRGLGLTFCRLAVEAHAGRIWVEDASPGAVFCVRLPHGL